MENKNENVKNEIKKEIAENVQAKINQLFVERERFKGTDGKEYWSYNLKGQVRGRDVRIDFAPKDKGGYEPLDIIFDVAPKAELLMSDETMTDNDGKKTKYTAYSVRTVENGIEYTCAVKPSRDSDKALLGMFLNEQKAKMAK